MLERKAARESEGTLLESLRLSLTRYEVLKIDDRMKHSYLEKYYREEKTGLLT